MRRIAVRAAMYSALRGSARWTQASIWSAAEHRPSVGDVRGSVQLSRWDSAFLVAGQRGLARERQVTVGTD